MSSALNWFQPNPFETASDSYFVQIEKKHEGKKSQYTFLVMWFTISTTVKCKKKIFVHDPSKYKKQRGKWVDNI